MTARKGSTPAQTKARQAARRRGSDFEKRVAARLGGEVWRGQDGDVEARGYRLECKYRTGLQLHDSKEFRSWHDQLKRYREQWSREGNPEKKSALVISGGARADREIYVCTSIDEFDRLTRIAADRGELSRYRDKLAVVVSAIDDLLEEEG